MSDFEVLTEPMKEVSIDLFKEQWLARGMKLEYDPDIFPKRFRYDVLLFKNVLQCEILETSNS